MRALAIAVLRNLPELRETLTQVVRSSRSGESDEPSS
jgi:hypothetical protein